MTNLPPLPKVPQKTIEAMRKYRKENPTPLMPCADQAEEDVAAYYKPAEIGAVAVVRQGYGGHLQYYVGVIEGRHATNGRVYIKAGHAAGAAFHSKSGKNCFAPTGQTRLVVPTPEVLKWAEDHPRGEFGFTIYRMEEHDPAPER
jgi:hypothetical protein